MSARVYAWSYNDDEYGLFWGSTPEDCELITHFDCSGQLPSDKEVILKESLGDPPRDSLPAGDFPGLGISQPHLLSEKAVNHLYDILQDNGCLQPARILGDENKYYLFKVKNVLDCLDLERSSLRKSTTGYVYLDRPVFVESKLAGQHIFVLPQFERRVVYVTDSFRELIANSDLKGIELQNEWGGESLTWRS